MKNKEVKRQLNTSKELKKSKRGIIAGAQALLGALMVGCSFNPSMNMEPAVYGPPEDMIQEPIPSTEQEEEEANVEEIDGLEEGIEYNGQNTDDVTNKEQSEDNTGGVPDEYIEVDYDPEMNVPDCIYGPPEMFE